MTSDIKRALKKAREGHMHFKMDSTSIVHVGLGKVKINLVERILLVFTRNQHGECEIPHRLERRTKYSL